MFKLLGAQKFPKIADDGELGGRESEFGDGVSEITQLLKSMGSGDLAAEDQLLRIVYDELKRIAASKLSNERAGHTLQTTALVNEAYLRLVGKKGIEGDGAPANQDSPAGEDSDSDSIRWDSRGHFFASAAEAMRRILIDNARRKKRHKRGGDKKKVPLDDVEFAVETPDVDLELLDQVLTKLESQNAQHAAIVKLRYFAGMTIEQVADALSISPATVKRSWAYSKVWLKREMGD